MTWPNLSVLIRGSRGNPPPVLCTTQVQSHVREKGRDIAPSHLQIWNLIKKTASGGKIRASARYGGAFWTGKYFQLFFATWRFFFPATVGLKSLSGDFMRPCDCTFRATERKEVLVNSSPNFLVCMDQLYECTSITFLLYILLLASNQHH